VEIVVGHSLAAPREIVFGKLLDFEVLARTLPGVQRLEPVDAETCRLVLKVLAPSITGTYEGTVGVIEKDPPAGYALRGDAKGRLGWLKGDARFRLADDGEATRIEATMTFQAGGLLAGVGQRFMEAAGKNMLRDFFRALERELVAGKGVPGGEAAHASAAGGGGRAHRGNQRVR
jgi:carbon monoxide dehydrogenase subunit G